jgi:hypothetical protein
VDEAGSLPLLEGRTYVTCMPRLPVRLLDVLGASLRGAGRLSRACWAVASPERGGDLLVLQRARARQAKAMGDLLGAVFHAIWRSLHRLKARIGACSRDDRLEELCRLDDAELLALARRGVPLDVVLRAARERALRANIGQPD